MSFFARRSILRLSLCALAVAAASLTAHATQTDPSPGPPQDPAAAVSTGSFNPALIEAYLRQPRFAHAAWGIAVQSLDRGQLIYAHDADRLLQTASTAKLFTAATVLDQPGPEYRMATRLLGGRISAGGRLEGALTLYGMGDPTLGVVPSSSDWASQLAHQLAQRGVHQIHGDLIADDSYFSGPSFGSGWEAEDLQTWFGVPTSALSVDENIVDLTVQPASRRGLPAGLVLQPEQGMPQLVSTLSTGRGQDGNAINLYRAPGSASLYAFGQIALRAPAQHFKLAMPDPARSAGLILADALRQAGIHLSGRVQTRHWPEVASPAIADLQVLAEINSPPVGDILQAGLKRSQNLYLQNLLQLAGIQYAAAHPDTGPGDFTSSADSGLQAMQALLGKIGIDPASVQISDGTGMSRRSLSTPRALVQLLTYLASQPYAASFRDDLPIAGVDGTLLGQFRGSVAANNLRAKTGSMSLVHCLAGYVTTTGGQHLAFAIMLNNYVAPANAPSIGHDVNQLALLLTQNGSASAAASGPAGASAAAN